MCEWILLVPIFGSLMAPGFPIPCQRPDPCGSKGREHYLLSKTLSSGNTMNFHSTYLLDCYYFTWWKALFLWTTIPLNNWGQNTHASLHTALYIISAFLWDQNTHASLHTPLYIVISDFLWYEVGRQHVKALQADAISPYLTSPTPLNPWDRPHHRTWNTVILGSSSTLTTNWIVPGIVPGSTLQSNSNMNELLIH